MVDQDSQIIPLAPVRINRSSDEELPTIKPKSVSQQQKSSKFLVYMLSTFVILGIIMLILGSTLLRMDPPKVRLRLVQVKNLQYGTTNSPSLQMNLDAQLTIANTNFGPFKFRNSSASMFYGNVTLGITYINSGYVKAKATKRMNITVQVRGDQMLMSNNINTNFSSDIDSRLVPLSSYAEMKGEVQVVKIITAQRMAIMNCTMKLNLTSQAFQDFRCI